MDVAQYISLRKEFEAVDRELKEVAALVVRYGALLRGNPEMCSVDGYTKLPVERAGTAIETIDDHKWPDAKRLGGLLSRWHHCDRETEKAFAQLSDDDKKEVRKPRYLE